MNKLMNGIYYEILGGLEEDFICRTDKTKFNDSDARQFAADTERYCYKNTYLDGKRIESEKLYDPYHDGYFPVGTETLYYEPLPRLEAFQYQMLGRLKADCDYFLGNGNGYEGHLWAGSVEKQIKEMRDRWNAFREDEKPEWLSMEDIDNYEKKMLKKRRNVSG